MIYEQETSEVLGQPQRGILPFCEDALRRVTWGYICWLLVAVLLLIIIYSNTSGLGVRDQVTIAVVFYLFVSTIHVIRRLKQGGLTNILAPDILFLFVYTLFHEAYLVLYVLGIMPYSSFVFYFESSIGPSLLIINLGLMGFHDTAREIEGNARDGSLVGAAESALTLKKELMGIAALARGESANFAG